MAITSIFPAIKPSLNLDFANTKSLDPRITFSRASAATYYDGKTVAKAEENLFVYSQDFEHASWAKGEATVTPNSDIAPDGTTTADTLTAAATVLTAGARVVQDRTSLPAGTYTFSVWLKRKVGTGGVSLGMVTSDTPSNTVALNISDSWQRFSLTVAISNPNVFVPRIMLAAVNDSVAVWGAQLEQRASVTAYTPTTTQPITNYIPVLQTAPAGVPRFDHNPVTGESLGLLVEEPRTNLITYSEFPNGLTDIGARSNISLDYFYGLGPSPVNGILFKKVPGGAYAYKTFTFSANTTYSVSVYVKMLDGFAPAFSGSNSLIDFAIVIAGAAAPASSYTVENKGNGVYRVTATVTTAAVPVNNSAGIVKYESYSDRSFIASGYQVEVGAFSTSYIKTEASQVTRAADSAAMTGANFSSWYRQDEGTLCGEASTSAFDASRVIAEINDNSVANRILIARSSATSSSWGSVTSNGAVQAGANIVAAFTAGNIGKTAIAYKADNFAHTANGANPVLDVSGLVPTTVNRLSIGYTIGTAYWSGHIKRIAYYPKRLTDAHLQALTA